MVNIDVLESKGRLFVSSKEVAKNFERNHSSITRSIDSIIKKDNSTKDLFIERKFFHSINKRIFREYLMTEEGLKLVVTRLFKRNPIMENEYAKAFKKANNVDVCDSTRDYDKIVEKRERFGMPMYEVYSIGDTIGLHKERVDLILKNSTINPICMDNKRYFTKNDLLSFMELARTSQCESLKKWLEGNVLEEKQEVLESLTEGQNNDEVLSKAFIMAQKIISDKDKQIQQLEKKVDKFRNALLQVMQQFDEDLEN